MLVINDKEYRNLQEQVYKNQQDILGIKLGQAVLDEFGIKVIGEVESVDDLPSVEDYKEEHQYTWAYGDAYAVGTEAPYTLYILTRANDDHDEDYWFDIGEFPKQGPQGETGAQGPQGPQGPAGNDGTNGTSAGFGTITATAHIVGEDQPPTASVTTSGPNTALNMAFDFGIPVDATEVEISFSAFPYDGTITADQYDLLKSSDDSLLVVTVGSLIAYKYVLYKQVTISNPEQLLYQSSIDSTTSGEIKYILATIKKLNASTFTCKVEVKTQTIEGNKIASTNAASGKVLTADGTNGASWESIPSPSIAWGDITGSIANQTDLSNALAGKQDSLATQTAYTSEGTATKVPTITTNSLGQVTGITETSITYPVTSVNGETGAVTGFAKTNQTFNRVYKSLTEVNSAWTSAISLVTFFNYIITAALGKSVFIINNENDAAFTDAPKSYGQLTVIVGTNTVRMLALYNTEVGSSTDTRLYRANFIRSGTTITSINWLEILDNSKVSNPNLLINSNFAINQRGGNSYNAPASGTQYCVDRHYQSAASISILISPQNYGATFTGGINIHKNVASVSGFYMISQRLENYTQLAGKTLTLSVKYRNNTGKFRLQANDGVSSYNSSAISSTDGLAVLTFTMNSAPTNLRVTIQDQQTASMDIDIDYWKLEVGPVATAYTTPMNAEELPKCKRYYKVINGIFSTKEITANNIYFKIPNLYDDMYRVPTLSWVGSTFNTVDYAYISNERNDIVSGFTFNTPYTNGAYNTVQLKVDKTSHGLSYANLNLGFTKIALDGEIY